MDRAEPAAWHRARWLALAVALAAALAYLPALRGEFVYDDQHYILDNPHVQSLDAATLRWALTTHHAGNWHPLTWLSHAVDVALFGLEPAGHHAVSLLLHAANAWLLVLALSALTGRSGRSAWVALLFALHPLHVESVAWIAERKDLLSTACFLLALLAYAAWIRRGGTVRYLLLVACFVAGLASKPMVVTLPFVLLLFDAWPLGRLGRRAVFEKLPLFALSAVSCWVTLTAQGAGSAISSTGVIGIGSRTVNAIVSYARYLLHAVWPVGLGPYYPYPGIVEPPYPVWALPLALVTLLALGVGAVRARRRRPYLLVGGLFYLGTLVPVIGLVQVGRQAMADRYTYIPLIGVFVAGVWLAADLLEQRVRDPRHRTGVAVAVAVAVGLVLGGLTVQQIGVWRDARSLWRRALEQAPRSPVPRFNLAAALARDGQIDAAIDGFRAAMEYDDSRGRAAALGRIGTLLQLRGDADGALDALRRSIELNPADAVMRANYANVLVRAGQVDAALAQYDAALATPGTPTTDRAALLRNVAALLLELGRFDAAAAAARSGIESWASPDGYEALAIVLYRAGRTEAAAATLREGLARFPGDARLTTRLGTLEDAGG